MIPPEWVCKKIEQVHPNARLGWVGEDRESPDDELNKGAFAIVQLFSPRAATRMICEEWNTQGPLYGSRFDKLAFTPVWITNISKQDVFSGKVIALLSRWITPVQERLDEVNVQRGRDYESFIDDVSHEMGTELYKNAQKSSSTCRTVAKKHVTAEEKAKILGEDSASVKNVFRHGAPSLAI